MVGQREKYNTVLLQKGNMRELKRKFLRFARPKVLAGYVSACFQLGWKIDEQQITNWNEIRKYIQYNDWDDQLQRDLHYLQYRRFKTDPSLYKWDEMLDEEFRRIHHIDYGEKKRKNMRGCFTILAVTIKTDYNKRLRTLCMSRHGKCVKERCDKMLEGGHKKMILIFEMILFDKKNS